MTTPLHSLTREELIELIAERSDLLTKHHVQQAMIDDCTSSKFFGQIRKAFAYTLRPKNELMIHLVDGRLEIDNKLIENAIRPVALCRIT